METENITTNDTVITNNSFRVDGVQKYVVKVENRQSGVNFTAYRGGDSTRAKRMVSDIYKAIQSKKLTW